MNVVVRAFVIEGNDSDCVEIVVELFGHHTALHQPSCTPIWENVKQATLYRPSSSMSLEIVAS